MVLSVVSEGGSWGSGLPCHQNNLDAVRKNLDGDNIRNSSQVGCFFMVSTVKMETLCSRFCIDIPITPHHIGIPLHGEAK